MASFLSNGDNFRENRVPFKMLSAMGVFLPKQYLLYGGIRGWLDYYITIPLFNVLESKLLHKLIQKLDR